MIAWLFLDVRTDPFENCPTPLNFTLLVAVSVTIVTLSLSRVCAPLEFSPHSHYMGRSP